MTMSIDQYAVFGNPIEHSKSQIIHQQFAEQTQQTLSYTKQRVNIDEFVSFADTFFSENNKGKGANVTVPFKTDAYNYAHQLTQRARQAGAVNTLSLQSDGTILGDNTDGAGLLNDIKHNLSWQITDKVIVILGAGGAVRGVLAPLLAEKPRQIIIANRTEEKAKNLAQAFSQQGNIVGCGYALLNELKQPADIVINGTSASLSGELPPLPEQLVTEHSCCYDMMYAKDDTVFIAWAKQNGVKDVADGLGMLVEQAAESFYVWRGIKPDTAGVINSLKIL